MVNRGLLEIGDSTGIVGVASFESTAVARWQVQTGGHIGSDEFNMLLISNEGTSLAVYCR